MEPSGAAVSFAALDTDRGAVGKADTTGEADRHPRRPATRCARLHRASASCPANAVRAFDGSAAAGATGVSLLSTHAGPPTAVGAPIPPKVDSPARVLAGASFSASPALEHAVVPAEAAEAAAHPGPRRARTTSSRTSSSQRLSLSPSLASMRMSSARTGSAKVCGRTGRGMRSGAGVEVVVDGCDDFCEVVGVLAVGEGGEAVAVVGGPDGGPSCNGRLY